MARRAATLRRRKLPTLTSRRKPGARPSFIQAELKVGPANDRFEREADQVADRVMSMGMPPATANAVGEGGALGLRRKEDGFRGLTASIQRVGMFGNAKGVEDEIENPEDQILQGKFMDGAGRIQRISRVTQQEEADRIDKKPMFAVQRKCDQCGAREKKEEGVQAKFIQRKIDHGGFTASNFVKQGLDSTKGGGRSMAKRELDFLQPRMGVDLSDVRIHDTPQAAELAESVGAKAFTHGKDIYFNRGQYKPHTSEGMHLLAHENTHVVQQGGAVQASRLQCAPKDVIQRKPSGAAAHARTQALLNSHDALKEHRDVLRAALREIKRNKSVAFNRQAGLKRVEEINRLQGGDAANLTRLRKDWKWLVSNRSKRSTKAFRGRERRLFESAMSRLTKVKRANKFQQAQFWMRHFNEKLFNLVIRASDSEIPADQLWTYANKEGMTALIRAHLGLRKHKFPDQTGLAKVNSSTAVSGFEAFGIDDFQTALDAKDHPLRELLPSDFPFDRTVAEDKINEKGRTVKSAEFPNWFRALQALAAMMKRRRLFFLGDAKKYGYGVPSRDELVYWTYLYFNVGKSIGKNRRGGKGQLIKYRGRRKLIDWYKKREYRNSVKVLDSYRMIRSLGIFK